MTKGRGGFKNIKLGKNVYRQLKRRGPPAPVPARPQRPEQPVRPHRQAPGDKPTDNRS